MTDYVADQLSEVLGGRTPLDVQIEAAQRLARGESLLVRVPTGSGKTLLASAPLAAGMVQPLQMVFMTPLRTLTGAQAKSLRTEIDGGASRRVSGQEWKISEQSGAVSEDPEFLARTVVCTFDQALSSCLQIPYSLSPRRRNLNAGAVLSAYLVADEVHLYPRDEALATLLWILRNRPPLPFCLMTATMTDTVLLGLAEFLGATPLSGLPDADSQRLGTEDQRRTVRYVETPLAAETIALAVEGVQRVLVVVNTVGRAVGLGRELRARLANHEVFVLHSRFYRRDRDRITASVLEAFGRDGRPAVLVATQVVEVGLDISADILLTELAPANALVQRFGRCARWGGQGTVVVARAEGPGYPYCREPGGPELLDRTRCWLSEHASGPVGLAMNGEVEQAFVAFVHEEADRAWLADLPHILDRTALDIGSTVLKGDYASAGTLIRSVEQRTLLVHGNPQSLQRPYEMEGFGVRVGTVFGLARQVGLSGRGPAVPEDEDLISLSVPSAESWAMMIPMWPAPGEASNAGLDQVLNWKVVDTTKDLEAASVVAINPSLVRYTPEDGLSLAPGQTAVPEGYWAPRRERAAAQWTGPFVYQRETLEQHVRRALLVVDSRPELWPRVAPLMGSVEAWLSWPPGLLRRLIVAAVVLHDTGKLTRAWQQAIREVQERRGRPYELWLAHSDSHSEQDPNGPAGRMPPHARSGAAHGLEVGFALDGQAAGGDGLRSEDVPSAASVLFTAIASHHNPSPRDLTLKGEELLDHAASLEGSRLLRLHRLPDRIAEVQAGESLESWLVRLDDPRRPVQAKELFVLAIVTRLLRLADGWSQERAGETTAEGTI